MTIEVEPAKFGVDEGNRQLHRDTEKNVQKPIDMGLRAVLTMQSFITGQLMIELDFHPGSPVHLRSPAADLMRDTHHPVHHRAAGQRTSTTRSEGD